MISTRKKKYFITQYNNLSNELDSIRTDSLESITKILYYIFNNVDNLSDTVINDKIDEIINLIYNFLEKVYTIVTSKIKNIFSNVTNDITEIHPYDKDGQTLEERVSKWIWSWIESLRNENSKENKSIIKTTSVVTIDRILNNEGKILKNQIIFDKTNKLAEYVLIVSGGGDCKGNCADYEGEWPINEAILPPYHVNCQCYFIPEITDDSQEIEDLDLEDDIDKEE